MSQRYRIDYSGAWLHVTNRGIARRPVFTSSARIRLFLDLLGQEVGAGWIEIHAFSILGTHFHLLLRSLRGESYRALMHAQNVYARTYNRQVRRDGPLFRGRFHSTHVASEIHWRNVVRYIDFNPVDARIVRAPSDYPFGSAASYLDDADWPWLTRGTVESVARSNAADGTPVRAAYTAAFGGAPTPAERRCVEARLRARVPAHDGLDDLVLAAPDEVQEWMQRKTRLADGMSLLRPVVLPATVDAAVRSVSDEEGPVTASICGRTRAVWPTVRVGLLRSAAGCSWSEVADLTGLSIAGAHGIGHAHSRLLAIDHGYGAVAARVLAVAIEADWPRDRRGRLGIVPFARVEDATARA